MKNIYIRVSTDKQNTQAQLFAIRQYCTSRGIKTDSTIEDNCSGTIPPASRNLGFLLSNSRKGDLIIVSEISRISRNEDHMAEIIRNARSGGYRIYAIKEGRYYGSNDAQLSERIMDVVEGHVSADFSRKTSMRTSESLQMRKELISKQGFFISNKGERITKLGNPDIERAAELGRAKNAENWMRKMTENTEMKKAWGIIIRMRAENEPNGYICKFLNDHGFVTSTGMRWTGNMIARFIRKGNEVWG